MIYHSWTDMLYLKTELAKTLHGSLDGLKKALQHAIQLEQSAIPPYLYALYSIKPDQNREIVTLLRSIMLEEMLHMALVCNVLNAIGGSPAFANPKLVPHYPGPLPGSVEGQLTVPLAPFSKNLVHDVFMVIEAPEHQSNSPKSAATGNHKPITVGDFYAGIKKQIRALSKNGNIFVGDPNRQLTTGFARLQTTRVSDAASALGAIDLIVEEGEGAKGSPFAADHELAHYYRFAEIFHGKKLVATHDPDGPEFIYGGRTIKFDPYGVWPVITNPSAATYAHDTTAANLNNAFNRTYTRFLKSLELVFNGEPDRLAPTISCMESMKAQALVMMSYEMAPGETAGPTFEYLA
jgi:hypothetical protein